jgi:hypothetical protein
VTRYLTTAGNSLEAEMVVSRLAEAGITAVQQGTLVLGTPGGTAGAQDIYVNDGDLDRARAALKAAESISEDELVQAEEESARNAGLQEPDGTDGHGD